jgi:general secretion pathway protein E
MPVIAPHNSSSVDVTDALGLDAGVEDAAREVAGDHGHSAGNAIGSEFAAQFVRAIPYEFARRHLIAPANEISGQDAAFVVRVAASTRATAIFNAGVALGRTLRPVVEDGEAIAAAIDELYARAKSQGQPRAQARLSANEDAPPVELEGSSDVEADLRTTLARLDADLLHTSGKSEVVRLVDLVLFEALTRKASDVHIHPLADRTLVRYRLDGVLHTVRELPAGLASAVTSRVKVMGRMDVAEQRAPQDGRATVTLGHGRASAIGETVPSPAAARRVDLRLSTMPTTYGERVVIRVLDNARSTHLLSFSALGMPAQVQGHFLQQAARTSGIVLVTGPTGSGKTTTLYTTLKWITQQRTNPASPSSSQAHHARSSGCELNIMTIEDPVEYDLSIAGLAVSQTPVNPKKNVTFATGLRHILRQDPDVIMVGEVRDEETARIAVQASLTGHLVLSTLHTNDAASAVARLIDLKVEPFLVSSSLAAVLAQRLVRCVHGSHNGSGCDGAGCEACFHTGYQGRTGVFELLALDEQLREEVNKSVPAAVIRQLAIAKGMTTLLRAGESLAKARVTTMAEVARVIQGVE